MDTPPKSQCAKDIKPPKYIKVIKVLRDFNDLNVFKYLYLVVAACDMGTECVKAVVDILITAINLLDAADYRTSRS